MVTTQLHEVQNSYSFMNTTYFKSILALYENLYHVFLLLHL